jgi:monovalent cation:H+ antiporter-2, CPA2 family
MFNFYLGIGILLLLASIGVYLVSKYGQSVILAYIVVGVLIGPNLGVSIGGFTYSGVISDQNLISRLLEFGLIFLFFFVGLEFSITKLKETKKAAAVIAITHVGANLFIGFIIATVFKWDLIGSIFLACVIATSSAAIATKTLKDLNRLSGNEVKFLLTSIIVEDFILIIIIALASGSAMRGTDLDLWSIVKLVASVCMLYGIFMILGFVIVPKIYKYLESIQSDELFILFALALIFLSVALADLLGIPRPLGAFFMGMTFAETKFSNRLVQRLSAVRMGSTAFFFMSFGMMISLKMDVISIVIPMVIMTVPLILFNHLFIHSSVAYLAGFTPKEALTIGTCLSGRGEDSLLYASVGANLQKVGNHEFAFSRSARETLFSFAGLYCFVMATLAPIIVKNIPKLVEGFTSSVPKKWAFGAAIIHRTLKTKMFTHGGAFENGERALLVLFGAYIMMFLGVILFRDPVLFVIFVTGGAVVIYLLYGVIRTYLSSSIDLELYTDMGMLIKNETIIQSFIVDNLVKLVAAPILIASIWGLAQILSGVVGIYFWFLVAAGVLVILGSIAMSFEGLYDTTRTRPDRVSVGRDLRRPTASTKGVKAKAKPTIEVPDAYEKLVPMRNIVSEHEEDDDDKDWPSGPRRGP